LAKQLIVVIRGALLALSHLQAQDLLVDVNLEQQNKLPVFRIHVLLGLPDPDPLVRGMDPELDPAPDPDPSIITPI
jgi:hypothetical protein